MSIPSTDKPTRPLVGQAINRITGPVKVTGQGRYTGEQTWANLVHGVLVGSTIAKGKVTGLDIQAAEAVPGVIGVMTHRNRPPVTAQPPPTQGGGGGTVVLPLSDTRIHYAGQPVALVLADTLENATYAASLVRVQYRAEAANTELSKGRVCAQPVEESKRRGNADAALATAPVRIDATYYLPIEHHNPIEPSGTVAIWEGDQLTVYEPTQWMKGLQQALSRSFNVPNENVHILTSYIGGLSAARPSSGPIRCWQ